MRENRKEALKKSLPEYCYTVLNGKGQIAKLTKGEAGYKIVNIKSNNTEILSHQFVINLNSNLGVSMVQEIAMYYGAMFGWEKNGANHDFYNDAGMEPYLRTMPGRKIERRKSGWTKRG